MGQYNEASTLKQTASNKFETFDNFKLGDQHREVEGKQQSTLSEKDEITYERMLTYLW